MNRTDDTSRFTVRRITADDAEAFARMLSHPEVYPQLLQMPFGSGEQWRTRLAAMAAPGTADVLLGAVNADGELVGGAGLHPAGGSMRRRHAMSLGVHVQPAWQRRGVGGLLMKSLIDYADNWLGLLRLELEVYTDNATAQTLYRRVGFVEEGVHRCHAMRDGVYVDTLSMARLNPAPLRGFPRD